MNKLICNNKVICSVYKADNFIDRLMGYMFRKKPHHEAILFIPCNSIHTFFMKFNIDILFISNDMRVIKKVEGLKRGKIVIEKRATMVIEAKEGMFKNINEGDPIDWQPHHL